MNIKKIYEKIFSSFGSAGLSNHIQKLIELDKILPYSSTFFCVTNTQYLKFEYISKNMPALLGFDMDALIKGGMRYFWGRIQPDYIDLWLKALDELMQFTMNEIPFEDRRRMNYTWNYRIKNSKGVYVNVIQNTTPLEFDSENKPVIGLAHYTILNTNIKMDVCASAKYLNKNNEYETKYFNNFSKKLLKDGISNRERDIVRLLVLNHSSKDIAEKLYISSNTVDTHRRNILKKLKLSSTGELVGLLKADKLRF